jgi:hypothetical protein
VKNLSRIARAADGIAKAQRNAHPPLGVAEKLHEHGLLQTPETTQQQRNAYYAEAANLLRRLERDMPAAGRRLYASGILRAALELDEVQYRPVPETAAPADADLAAIAELKGRRDELEELADRQARETAALLTRVAELEAQRERRRLRLIALDNDAQEIRGILSPNGEARKVPMPLGETLAPAVEWLVNRVAELEKAAVEARAALGSICCDLEDPGTAALGALYLLTQATLWTENGPDFAAQALAQHDAKLRDRITELEEERDDARAEALAEAREIALTESRRLDSEMSGDAGYGARAVARLLRDAAAPSPQPGTPEHATGAEQLLAAARQAEEPRFCDFGVTDAPGSGCVLLAGHEPANRHIVTPGDEDEAGDAR